MMVLQTSQWVSGYEVCQAQWSRKSIGWVMDHTRSPPLTIEPQGKQRCLSVALETSLFCKMLRCKMLMYMNQMNSVRVDFSVHKCVAVYRLCNVLSVTGLLKVSWWFIRPKGLDKCCISSEQGFRGHEWCKGFAILSFDHKRYYSVIYISFFITPCNGTAK